MLIDKYTKHSIFSLPLIFDDIVDRHELKANGFVNMYVYDLNIPLASNHIFLVFKNLSNELLEKFEKHHNYWNDYHSIINGVTYHIVCFQRGFSIGYIVDSTEKGLYYETDYHSKMRIIKFWNSPTNLSTSLHSYLFNPNAVRIKPVSENITKEDKIKKP